MFHLSPSLRISVTIKNVFDQGKLSHERIPIVPKVPLLPIYSFAIIRQTIIKNLAPDRAL